MNQEVLKALKHALNRLNSLPHNYDKTDFKLIESAISNAEKNKIKIAIEVKGGSVQCVRSNEKDIEIVLFDYDVKEDIDEIKEEPDKKEYPYTIY